MNSFGPKGGGKSTYLWSAFLRKKGKGKRYPPVSLISVTEKIF